MSKLTPFGIAVRKLRLDKNLRLVDMAQKLEMSTAFLSAIETGRKGIPDGLVTAISRKLSWPVEELKLITKAIDQTRKEVRLDDKTGEERELIQAFARRHDELPPDTLEKLRKLLLKSEAGEVPFERRRRGIVVPPASIATIRGYAEKVRGAFVPDDRIDFPIINVIEFCIAQTIDPDFVFDVWEPEEMGGDEGSVPIGGNTLVLRRDVYEGACAGGGRHRFTAAHEMGHYLMHRHIKLARARDDRDKIFTDSEWQADTFAGTLLMSPRHVRQFCSSEQMAAACCTSPSAASHMWRKYIEEGAFK